MKSFLLLPALLVGALTSACAAVPRQEPGLPSTLRIETPASGDPGFRAEVARADDGRVVATCTRPPCTLPLPTGRCELRVLGDWHVPDREQEIEVRASSTRVVVKPGDTVGRAVGATLGIAGPVAIVLGFLTGACMDEHDFGCTGGPYLLILGGIASTIFGWTTFALTKTSIDTSQPSATSTSRTATLFEF